MELRVKAVPGPLQRIRDVEVGEGVFIDDFVNLYECQLGAGTHVATFVEIGKGIIGKNCTIGSHAYICPGVTIEDDVVIGEGVRFINDASPRAATNSGRPATDADWELRPTLIRRGAILGPGSVIMCDVTVGVGAVVHPGSVVTRDVPDHATVGGNPARVVEANQPVTATLLEA